GQAPRGVVSWLSPRERKRPRTVGSGLAIARIVGKGAQFGKPPGGPARALPALPVMPTVTPPFFLPLTVFPIAIGIKPWQSARRLASLLNLPVFTHRPREGGAMKKLMVLAVAVVGLALLAAPAQAGWGCCAPSYCVNYVEQTVWCYTTQW